MAKPKSVVEALEQAKALIKSKRAWIQGQYVLDADAADDGREKFCAIGALRRVDGRYEDRAHDILKKVVLERFGCHKVESYNDKKSTSHGDVLRLFNAAIKEAQRGRVGKH